MTRFTGIKKFIGKLDDLSSGLRDVADELDDAVATGSRQTALDVKDTAERLAPKDTGELSNNIVVRTDSSGRYVVEARADHAADVEYGTKPHLITPNEKQVLKFESGGDTVYTPYAKHPGTDAQPFLRPALNRHQSGYVRRVARQIRLLIQEHI